MLAPSWNCESCCFVKNESFGIRWLKTCTIRYDLKHRPPESAVDKAYKMFHFNAQGAGKKKKKVCELTGYPLTLDWGNTETHVAGFK